ncbi:hypothetical protein MHU86_13453 [Fragilaria crotonensis]|nr:hypothetical protein MHU86_13453 [Fragilaria crotonensis]
MLLLKLVFMFSMAVEGRAEGNAVGNADEGLLDVDGTCEGLLDGGEVDGDDEGCMVDGKALDVGADDGDGLGAGESVGSKLGSGVGAFVGNCVGVGLEPSLGSK